jgi:hypothetical protein
MDALAETLRLRPDKSVIEGLFANDSDTVPLDGFRSRDRLWC